MLGTTINLIDQSQIEEASVATVTELDLSPVVLSAFASDKGTEKITVLKGKNHTAMYGAANFSKYGQVSIQNKRIIEAGARIMSKRVVATDAKLANVIIVANIWRTSVQKVNGSNAPLYYSQLTPGTEVTTPKETIATVLTDLLPVLIYTPHLKYSAISATTALGLDDVVTAGTAALNNTGSAVTVDGSSVTMYTYPIYAITDIGRGVSNKSFRLEPDYSLSKGLTFMYYTLTVMENGQDIESMRIALKPDAMYNGASASLSQVANTYSSQIQGTEFDNSITQFLTKWSEFTTIAYATLENQDFYYGFNRSGATLSIDYRLSGATAGINTTSITGVALTSGSNGAFASSPFLNGTTEAAYNTQLSNFFDGTFSSDIYDINSYQIDILFDANYATTVKEKIAALVKFRKDFSYWRDYGLAITTLVAATTFKANLTPSYMVSDFCQAYDVIDTNSSKQVKVSIMYSISKLMIGHLSKRRNVPFAGALNGAVITDAVEGTLTYKTKLTPAVDEKIEMTDNRINFASYYNGRLIVETLYTSQEDYTQLSFSNNVLALQQVMKALQAHFPAVRYQIIKNVKDIENITASVNDMLSNYASNFEELKFSYVPDSIALQNKIYKAKLTFRFAEFTQAENIDAYVLPSQIAA